MGFMDDFVESFMPDEAREAFKAAKAEQEKETAKLQMTAHALKDVFESFIRNADIDDVQMLELCILKAVSSPGEAPYMVGQIHSVVKDRGYCVHCFQALADCASGH